jgi:hypothetical protein
MARFWRSNVFIIYGYIAGSFGCIVAKPYLSKDFKSKEKSLF